MINLTTELTYFGSRTALRVELDERKFLRINTCDLLLISACTSEAVKGSNYHIRRVADRQAYIEYVAKLIANQLVSHLEKMETHDGYPIEDLSDE